MKKLTTLGGLLGFLIGTGFGLMQEVEWSSIVWRASISAAAAGLLFRWWGGLWIRGLRESHLQKLNAIPDPVSTGGASSAKS
jgi:hypothetical protein